MMLAHGYDILRAGLFKQLGPPIRIPVLCLPHIGKALVFKIGSISFNMMLIRGAASYVYRIIIPFGIRVRHEPFVIGNRSQLPCGRRKRRH